jgi:DNA-binding NarL/FixJ family response regulator
MENRLTHRSCLVYVYSNHPLVHQIIRRALTSMPYCIKRFPPAQGEGVAESRCLLIVDACSVEEWLKIVVHQGFRLKRPVLVLADGLNSRDEQLCLAYLGVSGIVSITRLEDDLGAALDSVLAGSLWMSGSASNVSVKGIRGLEKIFGVNLTSRERQIAAFLYKQFSNKEISQVLRISERTVKFHVSNIFQKLKVKTRKEIKSVA